ncbi:MAG: 50S ribosomal protein L13 [Proteobacteria bacterium]|jgi:large subunit ribosomal protein L13|nr:50S ribosomal protein L13 [Pseudomonadota bacterium]
MKTYSVKPADIKKQWVVVDAADQTVGRLATEVARVLRGKHKPTFVPHLDTGDFVVVINAEKVKFTGNKMKDKFYHHHTGWIGGIKSISAETMLAKKPERILEHAIRGMLPKGPLGRKVGLNLKVYAGSEHPHAAQKPVAMQPRMPKSGAR